MNPFEFRGPDFLVFYVFLSIIVLILTKLLRRMLDGSENPAVQSPATIVSDPYLLAYLRGDAEETLRVAAMSLIDRGLLAVESDGTLKTVLGVTSGHARRPVEKAILDHYLAPGPATELSKLKSATDDIARRLESLGLIPDGAIRARRWLLFLVLFGVIAGVALMKISIGISRGRPVGFLVGLLLVNFVIHWNMRRKIRTVHGDRFLDGIQRLFAGLKDRADTLQRGGATADLALLAAVFGMTAVPANVFPYRAQLLPPPSSSSSSGSSCSSSSCGGGGGCGGGGCGGCGG